jgi:hypothetical protein
MTINTELREAISRVIVGAIKSASIAHPEMNARELAGSIAKRTTKELSILMETNQLGALGTLLEAGSKLEAHLDSHDRRIAAIQTAVDQATNVRESIEAELTAELVKKTKLEKALKAALPFLTPGADRGPAHERWIEAMKLAGHALGWSTCVYCMGTGTVTKPARHIDILGCVIKNPKPTTDICVHCLSVGLREQDPDEEQPKSGLIGRKSL